MSLESNNVRRQKKQSYNHEFIKSEDFYVSELEAVLTHIVQPLQKNAAKCNVKLGEIKFVFGLMQHIFDFHLQVLRIIREEINVIPKLFNYFGFLEMYVDYLRKYCAILETIGHWKSIQFREFVTLRLQSEHVKGIIDDKLCSFPWYLYRPFERMKQYYRFFKDLLEVTVDTDDEFHKLLSCKNRLKPLYNKIKKKDVRFIKKTRLLEIQLQIFGNPVPIVSDNRYFVYNRLCQIKIAAIGKKFKHIHFYVFNDMILWVSKRGHWKKTLKFADTIIYGKATKNNSAKDPLLFIGLSSERKPTQILLADEQARNECLERIKKAHSRFLKRQQCKLEKEAAKLAKKEKSTSFLAINEPSQTHDSLTIDDSLYLEDSATNSFMPEHMTMRALPSHINIRDSSSDGDENDSKTNSNYNHEYNETNSNKSK